MFDVNAVFIFLSSNASVFFLRQTMKVRLQLVFIKSVKTSYRVPRFIYWSYSTNYKKLKKIE